MNIPIKQFSPPFLDTQMIANNGYQVSGYDTLPKRVNEVPQIQGKNDDFRSTLEKI